MNNKIYRMMAIFGIFCALAVAGVHAQTPTKVDVNIPFEFTAGKVTFEPGVYTIKQTSHNLLVLRRDDGTSAVILIAPVTLESRNGTGRQRLVFTKYEERYFLSQVWLTADSGRQIAVPASGKSAKPERVEISLRAKK